MAQDEKEARKLLTLCRYWKPDFPSDIIISSYFQQHHSLTEKEYHQRTLSLTRGDTVDRAHIISVLTELGFERYPRAVGERSFAVRGDTIDIVDRKALRIELDDDTIDHLRLFNPSTQQSGQPITTATIWPNAYASHLPTIFEHDLTYQSVTPKYYHKRFNLLKEDAGKFLKIRVATEHSERVKTLLPQAEITPYTKGLEGFIIPSEHYLFLTDAHIFGSEEQINAFETELDITELDPGDYVVHIDHGIALFDGRREIDDKQYLELHYANNDKLFIPAEQSNRVEKYIGGDNPKLTRLSTAQWKTAVHKAQEDVLETAKELLQMQAQRETAVAKGIPDTVMETEAAIALDVEFELTADQEQALLDIRADLTRDTAMNRLLCGDVGFGKTEVALRTAAHVIEHGGQVAFMAPTTVLAQQHYRTFAKRLAAYGVTVGVLSRLATKKEQTATIAGLQNRQVDVVIGTHRLLSSDISIPNLELVIVDEEQRFGVKHKEKLKTLRSKAHVLTMTATPIPRTLNLAMSGLQDISVLNTAPQNRQGVTTIIEEFNQNLELEALQEELDRGGQAYVVHNNLTTIYSRQSLLENKFPTHTVAIAHGQMEPAKLARVMRDFHAGSIDILLASTIIENGLDIANANTLIVEQAQNFGLAQLYQLRGRIGRSATKAYAYLLYSAQKLTPQAKRRLKALHAVKELGGGFELAMKDLEIRGVGDILGKKQHGHVQHIGLNLYTRLLQHAIEQLEHRTR